MPGSLTGDGGDVHAPFVYPVADANSGGLIGGIDHGHSSVAYPGF